MTSSSPAPSAPPTAGLLLVALTLAAAGACAGGALLGGTALAQEPAPETPAEVDAPPDTEEPPTGEQAGEVVIIYGEQEVLRLRAELDQVIRDGGYREGKRRGDKTTYRPETPWKPSIVIQEEGLVTLERSPVRFMAPGRRENPLNYLWCLPPFTPMCVRIGGQVVSTPKLDAAKGRVMEQVHDPSEAWRQSIANQATWARVNQEVPARIEATWATGSPVEPGGPSLATPRERRVALLEFWASRADTPEGAMVAQVVADFLELVVQTSPDPVTADELQAANQRAGGTRRLALPGAVSTSAAPSTSPPVADPSPSSPPTPDPG